MDFLNIYRPIEEVFSNMPPTERYASVDETDEGFHHTITREDAVENGATTLPPYKVLVEFYLNNKK